MSKTKTTGILLIPESYKTKRGKMQPVVDGALFGKTSLKFLQNQIKNSKVKPSADGSITAGITVLNNLEDRLKYFGFKGAEDTVFVNATIKKTLVDRVLNYDVEKNGDVLIVFGGKYDASDFEGDQIYLRYFDYVSASTNNTIFIPDEAMSKDKEGNVVEATRTGYVCCVNNSAFISRTIKTVSTANNESFFTGTAGVIDQTQPRIKRDFERINFMEANEKDKVYINISGMKPAFVERVNANDGKQRLMLMVGRYDFDKDIDDQENYAQKQRALIDAGTKEEGKIAPEDYIGASFKMKSVGIETVQIISK